MFENRLLKVYKHKSKQARRLNVSCYRVYDHDLPEFPFAIETKNARIAVAVGDENGTIGRGNRRCYSPFIWCRKARLGWSSNLLHHRSVRLHLQENPVLLWRAFLDCGIEVFFAVFLRVDQ